MQTQYISLCNNEGINIKNNSKKLEILGELEENFNVKIVDKHHELFCQDRHSARLQKVPHLVSLKSNGNPYLLYLTTINFSNVAIMIDKKVQMGYTLPRMIIIKLAFDDDTLFQNTLFEGEMILDKHKKWLYLISDIIIFKNFHIKKQANLLKRLETIHNVITNNFKPSFQNLFAVQIKKYVPIDQTNWLVTKFAKELTYTIRGIYLKPFYSKFKDLLVNNNDSLIVNVVRTKLNKDTHFRTNTIVVSNETQVSEETNVVSGTMKQTNSIEEYSKESNEEECTFEIKKTETPDVYHIYEPDTFVYKGIACIDSLKTSKFMNKVFQDKSLLTKIRFVCRKNSNPNFKNSWVPNREISL